MFYNLTLHIENAREIMSAFRDLRPAARPVAITLCLVALLAGCSGGGGGDACATVEQNRFVHQDLLDRYYWYQQVPNDIDYGRFASPQETLSYLRYDTFDRFSYIASQTAFDNLFNNGTYIGYGFSYFVEHGASAWVRFVYSQSPAAAAGMERGDEILSINGQSVASVIATDGWATIFGPAEPGIPLSIELRRKSGLVETLRLDKNTVTINTVLHSEVIDSGVNRIGYLVFNSFLNTSLAELDPVFAQFKADNVNHLILDLRYNGGGSISVARDLASYIKTTSLANSETYVELRYNDKLQSNNFRYYFRPLTNSLGLDELTVVISESTCSASEQLVSALQPYFSRVTTVGGSSCGKPVGMNPVDFCDLTLVAVNFAGFNAAGQGDYFDGIPADCAASDDVALELGDPVEPMLQAARYFIDNRSCQVSFRARQRRPNKLQGLQLVSGAV